MFTKKKKINKSVSQAETNYELKTKMKNSSQSNSPENVIH